MPFDEGYFREELDYLRQLGKRLAKEKPHLTPFLGEAAGHSDVEKLMEVFACFSSGLRQKLEDSFPELTHGMIHALWPNYLRPVPAMTVIEFKPKATLKKPVPTSRDEKIRTRTRTGLLSGQAALIKKENTPLPACHFTLAREVWLQPLNMSDIRNRSSLEKGILDIDFSTEGNVTAQMLDLGKLSFWLNNEDAFTRYQLYLWFSERLMNAELIADEYRFALPDLWLEPAGFEKEDAILPWPANHQPGFRVLYEYFCFPESFFFFQLRNTLSLPADFPVQAFTLRLHFSEPLPDNLKLNRNSLRPYCSPAVNLFIHCAEPVKPNQPAPQYPLHISHKAPEAYDIFQIKSVTSRVKESEKGSRYQIWPEYLGHHRPFEDHREREVIYWQHRTEPSPVRRELNHSIALVHSDGNPPSAERLQHEELNTLLICTHRNLPGTLDVGDICVAVSKNPAVASFQNITRPTLAMPPVPEGEMHWSLLACMNFNYLSLLEKDALIQLLKTFDIPGLHQPHLSRLSPEKIAAIQTLHSCPVDKLFKGIPVRGLATTLWMDPKPFICEGEMYLLGAVLSSFFALYASPRSFHCLRMINTENQQFWEWQHAGQHTLL